MQQTTSGRRAAATAFGDPRLERAWEAIAEAVLGRPSTADLFNPYTDRVEGLDRPDAAAVRTANLRAYLAGYRRPPALFLLAEAPGPWGCRFSGVPITAEAQLLDPGFPLSGARSSVGGDPRSEYSAGIFWRILEPAFPHFLVWNAVPLHPHRPGQPLTIRTPRPGELREFEPLVRELVSVLAPGRVLAIGRKAEQVLGRSEIPCTYVRHPSQGGAVLFAEGVRAALSEAGITTDRA
jgi:hypothetical protein